jgi:ADP-heptose:LPS heptosyltransferase
MFMIKTEYFEVNNAQLPNTNTNSELNHDQWQDLIAIHQTLSREHYDLFIISHHSSTSRALQRFGHKYTTPAGCGGMAHTFAAA